MSVSTETPLGQAKPAFQGVLEKDLYHPLAAGLVAGYLLNEGGGNKAYDLAGRNVLTNIGTIAWVASQSGLVWSNAGGSTSGTQALTAVGMPAMAGPLSIAVRGYFVLDNAANHTFVSLGASSGSVGINIAVHAGPQFGAYKLSNGAGLAETNPAGGTGFYDLVFTSDGTNANLYVNGVLTTATPTFDTGTCTEISLGVGCNASFPENMLSTERLVYAYVWHRTLAQGDVQQLRSQPYALVRTRSMRRFDAGAVVVIPPGLGPVVGMPEWAFFDSAMTR